MSGDRLSGATFGGDERAQTVQDFAVGISIFLLVVGAVFLLFPTLFTPYEQAIADEGPDSQADRIAMLIADNVSGDEATNELTSDEIEYWFENGDFTGAVGVSDNSQVNVTMTTMGTGSDDPIKDGGGNQLAVGPNPDNQDAATASRIVTVGDAVSIAGPEGSAPAYRLVVRVW